MNVRRALLACAALATLTWSGLATAAAPAGPWRAGVNYKLLENPQPPTAPEGKVEVTEVFWYGCGHCFALDPHLEEWNRTKPGFIEFVRVPVIWGPVHRQHAKIYYLIQVLHRPDLHAEVFKAIHERGVVLTDRDETKARAMLMEFFGGFAVNPQQFDAAYDSR